MTARSYLDSLVMKRLAIKLGHVISGDPSAVTNIPKEDLIMPMFDKELVPGEKRRTARTFPVDPVPQKPKLHTHTPGDDDPEKNYDRVQQLQTFKDINRLENAITETFMSMHQNR